MSAREERQGQDGERMLGALVDLARTTYTDDLSAGENLGLVRLEQTWERKRGPRRRWFSPGPSVLAAALAVAVVLPAAYLLYGRHPRLTYQVANGTVEADGRIRQTRPGTVVVFSEGSQIDVEAGARARVVSTTNEGGRLLLEDGDLRADIVHRPSTHWTVEAGPYTIRVTGTAFDVRWSVSDDRLECQMKHGSVVITGPLVPTGVTLTAGMRLTVSPRTHQLALDDASSGTATASVGSRGAVPSAPSAEPAPLTTNDDRGLSNEGSTRRRAPIAMLSPHRRESARRSEGPADEARLTWSRRLALGEFQSVLTDAEHQGLDRVLERAPAPDLSALADAARYTHHAATSRRALLALRARFPQSIESRDTAFFLGGLAEDETGPTATSIGWYEQYLRESPSGRFVNEALGRSMVLAHKLRGATAARPTAEEYLRRFPRGPYAAAARKLLPAL